MRIISGALRSRRLKFPKTKKTRPMMDRAKESIFNILGETVRGADVLDLFAGSGSMGLEALSRGAAFVTFVEKEPWGKKAIRENLTRLNLKERSRLVGLDIFQAIRWLKKRGQRFTIIFLDPPYNKGLVKKTLNCLEAFDILTNLTQVVVHHSRQEKVPEGLEQLKVVREKRIGQACLSFLSKGGE